MKHLVNTYTALKAVTPKLQTYKELLPVLKEIRKALIKDLKGPAANRGYTIDDDSRYETRRIEIAISLEGNFTLDYQLCLAFHFERSEVDGRSESNPLLEGLDFTIALYKGKDLFRKSADAKGALALLKEGLNHLDQHGWKRVKV